MKGLRGDSGSFGRILVANRGEIAVRILRTCRALGIETVLAVSEADRVGLGARLADRVLCIGPAPARSSYLNRGALVAAAEATKCDAVHPGYGFLSEDPDFAAACALADVAFIGPSPGVLTLLGDKVEARAAARRAGVPLLPGTEELASLDDACEAALSIGYPALLKASHGGGGRGIRLVADEETLRSVFDTARAEAIAAFGEGSLYLERFVPVARHVEVQIAGDGTRVVHFGDRDCSVQRRHQKLVEEAPAPALPPFLQDELRQAAVRLGVATGYDNIGTVEFLVDPLREECYFLEVNPRLQVEHGVTELVTGVDLVALQIILAESGRLPLEQRDISLSGCAIECRINAEDPTRGFAPSPGGVERFSLPHALGVRVDTHCYAGYTVSPFYDSLLAKLMTHGVDRVTAIERMLGALDDLVIDGVHTTRALQAGIIGSEDFGSCSVSTRWLDEAIVGSPGEIAGLI